MSDKPRQGIKSGDDRALLSLEQRRSTGVPFPAIEPEPTPPPMEPPAPSSIPGFASITDEVQAQLTAIHLTQREQDVAIARMWDARKLGEEVQNLRSVIGSLAAISDVPELLRIQGERMRVLLDWRETSTKAGDRLLLTIESLDERLRTSELSFTRIETQISALDRRIGEVFKRIDVVDTDLEQIGRRLDTELESIEKRTDAKIEALAIRVVSLEADRSRFKWTVAIVVFFGAIFAWFASSQFWPGR